jgi:hypothetical protein
MIQQIDAAHTAKVPAHGFSHECHTSFRRSGVGVEMSTQKEDKQQRALEKEERERLAAVIGNRVMHTLGQPGDLHMVQVRHLWEDCYRVNVLVGADTASARVLHSYFLVVDLEGNIIESTPKITRQY